VFLFIRESITAQRAGESAKIVGVAFRKQLAYNTGMTVQLVELSCRWSRDLRRRARPPDNWEWSHFVMRVFPTWMNCAAPAGQNGLT